MDSKQIKYREKIGDHSANLDQILVDTSWRALAKGSTFDETLHTLIPPSSTVFKELLRNLVDLEQTGRIVVTFQDPCWRIRKETRHVRIIFDNPVWRYVYRQFTSRFHPSRHMNCVQPDPQNRSPFKCLLDLKSVKKQNHCYDIAIFSVVLRPEKSEQTPRQICTASQLFGGPFLLMLLGRLRYFVDSVENQVEHIIKKNQT